MTGSSTLTTNGAVIGRRSKGLLSVGPMALVDVKGPRPNFGAAMSVEKIWKSVRTDRRTSQLTN